MRDISTSDVLRVTHAELAERKVDGLKRFAWQRTRPALVWLVVSMAVVVQLPTVFALMRDFADTLRMSRLPADQQQRYLNGPITAYAQQLEHELPPDACVQFDWPPIADFRAHGGNLISQRASVLSTVLYPRRLRLVADANEALGAPACADMPSFVVVWMDAGNASDAQFVKHLATLDRSPNARKISSFTDHDGNTGAAYEVKVRTP
jgi:hypothetical protein